MVFDIDLIRQVYASYTAHVDVAAAILNHPLTLTEKILQPTSVRMN
jgi:hypothetical protein